MVTIKESKIIIEIEDSSPELLLLEFKTSIIEVLKHLDFKSPNITDLESSQYFILKMLQELLNESEN